MKIKWYIHVDGPEEGYFDMPDDTPADEIEEAARDNAFNGVDWGWTEVDGKTLCPKCSKEVDND